MKVAWIHNFAPEAESSGVFMHELAEAVRGLGCEVQLVYTGTLRSPGALFRLGSRIGARLQGCDLLHAQYGSACGFAVSRLPGAKVLSLRGSDWYGSGGQGLRERLHGFLAKRLTRASLPRYDAVICMSLRMKTSIDAFLGPGITAAVIPDGIDLNAFSPCPRSEARTLLGCPSDETPWVLFSTVHTGNRLKRPWLARQAFELARKEVPELQFKVMTGLPHDRVPAFVNACDVVLLTSTHEGWPNIIKEALACNVPFVSTDVSDLKDIADVEPSCCVTDDSPESLARGIVAAIRAGRAADLRRHVEPMSMERTARRLIDLYEQVLGRQDTACASG